MSDRIKCDKCEVDITNQGRYPHGDKLLCCNCHYDSTLVKC